MGNTALVLHVSTSRRHTYMLALAGAIHTC